jgi:hypothetical protein
MYECIAECQFRIGDDWRGLLGEGDLGEKQQRNQSKLHKKTWL